MNTNVCFYEIKDKLSTWRHFAEQMFKQNQFKRKHERSQVLFQKYIYPRGFPFWTLTGVCLDANVLGVGGEVIGGVE